MNLITYVNCLRLLTTLSFVLKLGIRWKQTVSYPIRPLYTRGKSSGTHWIGDSMGYGAGMDKMAKKGHPFRYLMTYPRNLNLSYVRQKVVIFTLQSLYPRRRISQ